ncbi:hypothetical protein HYV80_05335 [Candidatus Woesearchaeota archaeon]|nr:hypothetical protein [Candidatus Woesearchaeota archaeon]
MADSTLADRLASFSKVRIKKTAVKVPRLKANHKVKAQKIKGNGASIHSVINILLKAAVEKAKKEKKEPAVQEHKSYKLLKDEKDVNGGYGSVSKAYGTSPGASYANYEKLFSYLGSFRAKQPYENTAEHLGAINKATESSGFNLINTDSMDKVGKYIKYFRPADPRYDFHTAAMSLVPMFGMNSGEWEQVRLWMMLDPVMYALKMKSS